jgi:hypothetical protein
MSSILDTTRLVAAQRASGRTLLVSSRGPAVVSRIEEAGPATWWAGFYASLRPLLDETDERQDLEEVESHLAAVTSTGELVFDAVVVDGRTQQKLVVDFFEKSATNPLRHADFVVLFLSTVSQDENGFSIAELGESLAQAGWFRAPSDLLVAEGVTGVFSRRQPTIREIVVDYERILEATVKSPTTGRGQQPESCLNDGCRASIEAARSQALQDRDRLVGMFARVMNLQYELDHLRTIVVGAQRDLTRTNVKLASARRALKKAKQVRSSRLKRAVTNPMRAAKSLRRSGVSGSSDHEKSAPKKRLS